MLTHIQLVYVLSRINDKIKIEEHGQNYVVVMPIDELDRQTGHAWIAKWKFPFPPPSDDEINAKWEEVKNDFFIKEKGDAVRPERNRRLAAADALVARAMDAGNAERVAALGQYRQALRDLPEQPDFPNKYTWPILPE